MNGKCLHKNMGNVRKSAIFHLKKQARKQEPRRNKRQVRLLWPGIMKTEHLTNQMRLSTGESESWLSPKCSSKFFKCKFSYTPHLTKPFPESTGSSLLGKAKSRSVELTLATCAVHELKESGC